MEEVKKNRIGHSHVDDSRGRRLVDWGYIRQGDHAWKINGDL
jgi:hypothetical protein